MSKSILKLHKTQAMDNSFIEGKLLPRLNFNPGLALTDFRKTLPWLSMSSRSSVDRASARCSEGPGLKSYRVY